MFTPIYGAEAEKESSKMVRQTTWLYFDGGKAKISPETLGIQRLAERDGGGRADPGRAPALS